ncbi:hypothetical protein [Streptococcus dentiloxodontae]
MNSHFLSTTDEKEGENMITILKWLNFSFAFFLFIEQRKRELAAKTTNQLNN